MKYVNYYFLFVQINVVYTYSYCHLTNKYINIVIDLGLVAIDSHLNSASFGVFKVYFKQNNKNIIFTTIFATFYFEIAVK